MFPLIIRAIGESGAGAAWRRRQSRSEGDEVADQIGVLIADSDQFMAEALASVLQSQPGIHVLGTVTDADGAVAALDDLRPTVSIIDMELVYLGGVNLGKRLRDRNMPTGIVYIGQWFDPGLVVELICDATGGSAFIKHCEIGSVQNLTRVICAVADGSTVVSDYDLRRSLAETGRGGQQSTLWGLTPKEREVLAYVADGSSNFAITEKMNLRERTVGNYVGSIFKKLGVGRRSGCDPRVQAALFYLTQTGHMDDPISRAVDAVPGPLVPDTGPAGAEPIELFKNEEAPGVAPRAAKSSSPTPVQLSNYGIKSELRNGSSPGAESWNRSDSSTGRSVSGY